MKNKCSKSCVKKASPEGECVYESICEAIEIWLEDKGGTLILEKNAKREVLGEISTCCADNRCNSIKSLFNIINRPDEREKNE